MPPTKEQIRAQLRTLLTSEAFNRSDCLGRFLQFTVEHTIEEKQTPLKEYLIGVEVYGRRPPYHPSRDSIVRTEARRLRSKLKDYYQDAGKFDPVLIYYRPGRYVALFRENDAVIPAAKPGYEEGVHPAITVAVLPFADISETREAVTFAAGLTGELKHHLLRVPGIRVRASALPKIDPCDRAGSPESGDVEWILDGTVQVSAGRAKVTARLSSVNGLEVTSQQFEISLSPETSFQEQERIARALTSRIAPQCSNIRRYLHPPKNTATSTESLNYYAHLLAAEDLLDRGSSTDLNYALEEFKSLTRIFPECARANTGLAQAYLRIAVRGGERSIELVALGKVRALEAVKLAPAMMGAHSALGAAFTMEWVWTKAEESFRTAVRLGVNQTAFRQFGLFQTIMGRFDEGEEYLTRATRIDPFSQSQRNSMARYYFFSRRFDEGLKFIETLSSTGDLSSDVQIIRAFLHIATGQHSKALLIAKGLQRGASVSPTMIATVAEIVASAGDYPAAHKLASDHALFDPTTSLTTLRRAFLACAFSNPEQALDFLEQAVEAHEAELPWLPTDPRVDLIANTVRFKKVLARMAHPTCRANTLPQITSSPEVSGELAIRV